MLATFSNWFAENKLAFSLVKTKVVRLKTRGSKPGEGVLDLIGTTIENVVTAKFLGVTLEAGFTWTPKMNSVCSKIARGNFAMAQQRGRARKPPGKEL